MKEKMLCSYLTIIGIYGFSHLYLWLKAKDVSDEEKREMIKVFDPHEKIWEFVELVRENKKEGI